MTTDNEFFTETQVNQSPEGLEVIAHYPLKGGATGEISLNLEYSEDDEVKNVQLSMGGQTIQMKHRDLLPMSILLRLTCETLGFEATLLDTDNKGLTNEN